MRCGHDYPEARSKGAPAIMELPDAACANQPAIQSKGTIRELPENRNCPPPELPAKPT